MRRLSHEHVIEGLGTIHHAHPDGDRPHGFREHKGTADLREAHGYDGIERITTRDDLAALASQLGMTDWHEPAQQGVGALVSGHVLDNEGFWGQVGTGSIPSAYQELWVTITEQRCTGEQVPVAEVNLASLLAWACGYRGKD